MRARPWAARVRIVAVTGWSQAEDRRRTSEARFDDHYAKPLDPDVARAWAARVTEREPGPDAPSAR
jgi:CheY-like chemotaxis protein